MPYQSFEELPVWQAAIELALRIYGLTDDSAFCETGDLSDQLRRASLSVSNNIAEGYERGTTPDRLMFLYIARGSAGETRSQLRFCQRRPRFVHLKSQITEIIPLAESCSRQLHAWADSLQNSDIKGQRHLTDAVREAYTRKRRADAFLEKLRFATPHLHPKPKTPES
jgi:four helix bundle protein